VCAALALIALVSPHFLNQQVLPVPQGGVQKGASDGAQGDGLSPARQFVGHKNVSSSSGSTEPRGVPRESRLGIVKRVVDGDTVYLMDGAKVRLYGIDAPERDQPYGAESTRRLRSLIGESVYVDSRDVDRYGRDVAVLFTIEGLNINLEMVCTGAAWWYERYAKREAELRDCQSSARSEGIGLWGSDAMPPWEWRRQ